MVATNAAGVARGDDKTLRTAVGPRPPAVSSSPATGVSAAGATLVARVSPRGINTSVHFEYGTSTSYGASTPEVGIGAATGTVTASAPIGGLKPGTTLPLPRRRDQRGRRARGGDRSFSTGKAPTGVATTFSSVRAVWGSGVTVTGKVSGVGSTPVALEKQDFPYTGAFVQVAAATANRSGNFSMTSPALGVTTRMRVVTRTAVVAASAPVTVSVAVKVGLKTRRLSGKRVQLTGTLWPAVPQGRVSLQRQSSTGHWNPVARATPTALPPGRSHYRFTVRRHARALAYRVVVLARDGGAHVPGTSRVVPGAARGARAGDALDLSPGRVGPGAIALRGVLAPRAGRCRACA